MDKHIKWISLWAAISGLFFQLIAFISFQPLKGIIDTINYVSYLSPQIYLSFAGNRLFEYRNPDHSLVLNYFNLAFYFMLLVGAILYLKSKGRETRLLGFSFSIMGLAKALALISISFSFFRYFTGSGYSIWILFLNLLTCGFWVYVSYKIVKQLSKSAVEISRSHKRDQGIVVFQESSKSQRFAHHIFDLVISVLVFSAFFLYNLRVPLSSVASVIGERGTIYLMVFVGRLIYLPITEGLFGISPAKFLTSSKVINEDGTKVGYGTAFVRTIIRHVPLEAFSFFGDKGWHDGWSKTLVVNTHNESFRAGRFLWFLPAFILAGILGYVGNEMYDDYKSYLYQKKKHELKIEEIRTEINRLSTSHLIQLEDVKHSYISDSKHYLKVEAVKDSIIIASVMWIEKPYRYKHSELEAEYKKSGGFLDQIQLSKQQLLAALTVDYDDYDEGRRKGVDFLKDDKRYEIAKIYRLFGPAIEDKGTGGMGRGTLSLRMCNYGWPCYLIDIEAMEGALEWQNELPQRLESTDYDSFGSFRLEARNVERGVPYRFNFTVEDTLMNRYVYQVEGINMDRTCTLLEVISKTENN